MTVGLFVSHETLQCMLPVAETSISKRAFDKLGVFEQLTVFCFFAHFAIQFSVAPSFTIQGYVVSHSGLHFCKVLVFVCCFCGLYGADGTGSAGRLNYQLTKKWQMLGSIRYFNSCSFYYRSWSLSTIGITNGFQTKLNKELLLKTSCVHCRSHLLNLAAANVAREVKLLQGSLSTIRRCTSYYRSWSLSTTRRCTSYSETALVCIQYPARTNSRPELSEFFARPSKHCDTLASRGELSTGYLLKAENEPCRSFTSRATLAAARFSRWLRQWTQLIFKSSYLLSLVWKPFVILHILADPLKPIQYMQEFYTSRRIKPEHKTVTILLCVCYTKSSYWHSHK